MANKIFSQKFAGKFAGIDGQMSAIEPDSNAVNRAVNLEMAVGNSLRGRVGCQTSGYGFFAIFPYRYTRTQDQYDIVYQAAAGAYPTQTPTLATTKITADGASIEKLIAINKQIWVLDTKSITITQTNAGTYTWYSYVNGSNINLNILKNGVSILDTSLGDGITSVTSIYSLLGTIDALADLAVSRTTRGTCPPFAIINGNQTSTSGTSATYSTKYTWTVANTPHNFYAGDIITWINSSTGILQGGMVISTTATTIVYVGPQGTATDGQVLGYLGQAASNFPISTVSSESSGVFSISFPYWRLIPEGDKTFGAIYNYPYDAWSSRTTATSGLFYAPPVAVSDSGNLYVAATGTSTTSGIYTNGWINNLIKIDGLTAARVGLPSGPTIAITLPGGPGITGTYKYKGFFRKYDAQGNIVDGVPGPTKTVTLANEVANVTTVSTIMEYALANGYGVRSCYKYTAESPASGASFYVDDNSAAPGISAFLQPGDPVCLTDTTAPLAGLSSVGTLHRTVCTAYDGSTTPTSIKVADSNGYAIADNTEITAGLTVVVLRTAAGGNTFYKLFEIPFDLYAAGTPTAQDGVTDAVLTSQEQYIEAEIGKEHNPPPACTLVCQHQGGLVVARGPLTPNTVSFSTADGVEYFPTASNSLDIPSNQSGFITAIASDVADRLAVFKEKAYYDIAGDLDGGAFSVNVVNEGDYGITSQASLTRVAGSLLGLSKNGLVTIKDGFLDAYRFIEVNARFINQPYRYDLAVGTNDYFNRNYLCTIPQITGEPVGFVVDYSRGDIKTLERTYPTKIDQAGGYAMIGNTLYHLSQTSPYGVFRRLIRFDSTYTSPTGDNGDSFIDNTSAINYVLESNVINFGEPAKLKTPIRIRIWSLPNDYVQEGWVTFATLVESGSSAIASYVGGSNPLATSSSVTFTTANDAYKDVKLINCKTHFYILRLTTNTIRTAPFWTGFEIMFSDNYPKEDLLS